MPADRAFRFCACLGAPVCCSDPHTHSQHLPGPCRWPDDGLRQEVGRARQRRLQWQLAVPQRSTSPRAHTPALHVISAVPRLLCAAALEPPLPQQPHQPDYGQPGACLACHVVSSAAPVPAGCPAVGCLQPVVRPAAADLLPCRTPVCSLAQGALLLGVAVCGLRAVAAGPALQGVRGRVVGYALPTCLCQLPCAATAIHRALCCCLALVPRSTTPRAVLRAAAAAVPHQGRLHQPLAGPHATAAAADQPRQHAAQPAALSRPISEPLLGLCAVQGVR